LNIHNFSGFFRHKFSSPVYQCQDIVVANIASQLLSHDVKLHDNQQLNNKQSKNWPVRCFISWHRGRTS